MVRQKSIFSKPEHPHHKPHPRSLFRTSLNTLPANIAADLLAYGRVKDNVITLAQGEGTLKTPDFICSAAQTAMNQGKTFYGPALGLPEMRLCVADYYQRIFNVSVPANRVFMTASATNAVYLALSSIIEEKDEVIAVTPMWKNLMGIMEVTGAKMKEVSMDEQDGTWSLDLNKIYDACTSRTRAILLVTPSNPNGWVMPIEQMKPLLNFAREKGIWIISDELYARSVYGHVRSPSFLDIAREDDRLYVVGSFSKNWAMTGWRLGWLIGPAQAEKTIQNMVLYSTMGIPAFIQYGGIAALTEGEGFLQTQLQNWESNRDMVYSACKAMPKVTFLPPEATFYAFLKIEGMEDSAQIARYLIDEVGVSLAPGGTFGSGCHSFLRLCFGADQATLEEGLYRLDTGLRAL